MNTGIDRRDFLQTTAATGLALTAAQSSARAAKAKDSLVVGVMGMGGRGRTLATVFQKQEGVEVEHVCDVDRLRAEQAVKTVEQATGKKPAFTTNFREILEDDAVDILVIATCNHWHAPATVEGCNHGKHVYVEKPASHNAHEGELMVEAAKKHDRRVQLGTQRRSWPKIREAVQRLQEGVIGRAYFAQAWYNNLRGSIGTGEAADPPEGLDYDMWQGPAPRKPFHTNYLHYNWHWFWHWGNGELGNNGIHMLDLCRWGLGVDHPSRVSVLGGRYRWDDDQDTPDVTLAAYDFQDEQKSIRWEGLSCNRMPGGQPADVIFHGEEGSLAIHGGSYTVYDRRGSEKEKVGGSGGNDVHIANFVAAVRGEEELNAPITEGHVSTHLCNVGNISWRKGRTLNVDQQSGHIVDDEDAMELWKRQYEPGWEPQVR